MRLKDLGEFGIINRISKKIKLRSKNIIVGIGDDCAAFKISGRRGKNIVLFTSDILIERVHFTLDTASDYQIGWKAMASSISDIAAMAGIPKYAVISIGLKDSTQVSFIDGIYKGIEACCGKYNVTIVGGDTVSSPCCIVINVSLIGEVEEKNLVRRNGANPGDGIFVTGFLGDASLGFECLKRNRKNIKAGKIISRFLTPVPRVREARALVESCRVTSMIDISDGLANEINHVARESKVGAVIYQDRLPFSGFFTDVAGKLKVNPVKLALYGGEDYELLFTADKKNIDKVSEKIKKETGTRITLIGEIVKKKFGVKIINRAGKGEKLEPKAFEHFKKNR